MGNSEQSVLIERHAHVGLITINRPEVRNALNFETWKYLTAAFAELEADNDIRVIVVTGAGDKAFVAGADLNALKERSAVATFYGELPAALAKVEKSKKPLIAAINGFALGGGLELALACDIRIASDKAKFGQTEINVGIIPGYGGTQRLPRLVGTALAKEMIFTGKIISATEAEKIGLVNRVVPAEELMTTVMELANDIAAKSPLIVQIAKQAINYGVDSNMQTALQLELLSQSLVFATDDHSEGICAFLEKRSPMFKGQ